MNNRHTINRPVPRLSSATAVGVALLLTMIHSGCIRQGIDDDCLFPLRLHFSYNYNREQTDLLRDEIPTISLRLYDAENGAFVKAADIDVDQLDADNCYSMMVPPGRYSLVSWGGIVERYSIDNANVLADHTLTLPAADDGSVAHKREHLWHQLTTGLNVDGNLSPVHDIDLHKISNDVTVTVASADGSPLKGKVSSFIESSNALYDFTGHVSDASASVRYYPQNDSSDPSRSVDSYTTLSLERNDDSALSVSYDDNEIFNGSLTALIARQPDIIFDLDDDFRLDFTVNPGPDGMASVTVRVNNWRVSEYNVTLK